MQKNTPVIVAPELNQLSNNNVIRQDIIIDFTQIKQLNQVIFDEELPNFFKHIEEKGEQLIVGDLQNEHLKFEQLPDSSEVQYQIEIYDKTGKLINFEEKANSQTIKINSINSNQVLAKHLAIQKMQLNEISWIFVPSYLEYNIQSSINPQINKEQQNIEHIWKIQINKIQIPTIPTNKKDYNLNYKLAITWQKKEEAKIFFQDKQYQRAFKLYKTIANTINSQNQNMEISEQTQNIMNITEIKVLENCILCKYKLYEQTQQQKEKQQQLDECYLFIEKCLKIDENNIKALYYKAQCKYQDNFVTESLEIVKNCLKIKPDSKEAKKLYEDILKRIKTLKDQEKLKKQAYFQNQEWEKQRFVEKKENQERKKQEIINEQRKQEKELQQQKIKQIFEKSNKNKLLEQELQQQDEEWFQI